MKELIIKITEHEEKGIEFMVAGNGFSPMERIGVSFHAALAIQKEFADNCDDGPIPEEVQQ